MNRFLSKQPLSRRIIAAFVLIVAVVGAMFSVSIVIMVHVVEEHLASKTMRTTLDRILNQGKVPAQHTDWLDVGTRLYYSHGKTQTIPPALESLDEGFHEIFLHDNAYYAFVATVNKHRYVLVQNQNEFENRERILFSLIAAAFLLSVISAWGLGWWMAKRLMAPIIGLSNHVKQLSDGTTSIPSPASLPYANDEIGQLAAAFDHAFEQLQNALARERLFTGDVSHELRTPLMIIGSSAELLQESQSLTAPQRRQLDKILNACKHMQQLTQTLLFLARHRHECAASSHMTTLIEEAQKQFDYWCPRAHAQGLSLHLRQEGLSVRAYHAVFLHTVLSNLLRNALHYTQTGEIRLVLESEGFRVEDSGPGISDNERQIIFQPFTRGKHDHTEGHGLGLSLVDRICRYEGWSITISSLTPRGACFRVALSGNVDRSATSVETSSFYRADC